MTIINLAIPFFGLIFIGFACGRLMPIDRDGLGWLNFFIVYVALPPMLFRLIANAPFEHLLNGPFVLGTTLAGYIVFVIVFAIAVIGMRVSVSRASIQASVAAYGNVGYMGVPLTVSVFGPAVAIPATLILCFDSLLNFILVPVLQTLSGHEKGGWGQTMRRMAKGVLLHPFIIATALGFVASYYDYTPPMAIDRLLKLLGDAAPACALFALGVTVAKQPLTRVGWELPFLAVAKLFVHPVVMLLVLLGIGGIDPLWIQTAVLMAALPTAANVFVMANYYQVYVAGTSSAILLTTIVSIPTVAILLLLLAGNNLPVTLG
jgi:predicted permease